MLISMFAVPVLIAAFVGIGAVRRVGVYDCFVEGAKDGLQSMVGIVAPLIGPTFFKIWGRTPRPVKLHP